VRDSRVNSFIINSSNTTFLFITFIYDAPTGVRVASLQPVEADPA